MWIVVCPRHETGWAGAWNGASAARSMGNQEMARATSGARHLAPPAALKLA